MNTTAIKAFWEAFLDTFPAEEKPTQGYTAWHFCNTEELANRLGDLVLRGTKTATSSLVWTYEAENEALPKAEDLSVIINWNSDPLCIIETTEAEVKPFNTVDAAFAYDEGEGDRSLAYWRSVHWEFFAKECKAIGREASETMPVVCERFRIVYPIPRKDNK